MERGWLWLKGLPSRSLAKVYEIYRQTTKIATDDPRKLIHSFKVSLTLTLVSFFYYFRPLYNSFGVSAMWAVMTVVVVFEFSVGATLGKGLNRGLATLAAGALGVGANHLASLAGKTSEPILIGLFVFIQATASTFVRFVPRVKARYDYGMLIFILTFSLVSISGIRTDEILNLAQKRLSTILIGASTCVIVSICVCPVWAGEDLHNLIARNIEKLGSFLEDLTAENSRPSEAAQTENGSSGVSVMSSLNSVLDSKSSEETLANFARWEPGHGRFMYRHPWKQYVKIGNLTRQCARRVEALINAYLNSKTQAAEEIRGTIQDAFSGMISESGKALKEVASAIETMSRPPSPNPHLANLKIASKNLKSLLKSDFWEGYSNLSQVIRVAAVASLLIDIVVCVENIADAVNELSTIANFKCKDVNFRQVLVEIPSHVSSSDDEVKSAEVGRQILNV
ncbi:UNVERIFIED_CONTAM: Aluminum-activated malate transporter 2 [Sesamum radiatum]|uniref:Aluminum-activated malate transporter 2 n=1 Tax=Sesamum radiatum TaxID=300843 RepID=A0AAW2UJQ6_SESRA